MSLTWLHIADFHIRAGDPYDRDVVLRALIRSINDYRAQGRVPDIIFVTGDIAHSGKPQEYEIAGEFFDDLLGAIKLDRHRLFIVPGNHDVDRELGIGLARTLDSREQSDAYFRPDIPKPHLTQKMRSFVEWHNRYFEGVRRTPENSTCGPVELLALKGRRLGILPINTALFCQGDDDHDKLWIGRRCLDVALSELRKIDAELNIALLHHPLDWLSATEMANVQAELEASVHILLRGHLHETRVQSVASPEGEILQCATGAAYQTRKWPIRALYATLEGRQVTIFPIRYEDSPRERWTIDPSVFPPQENHTRRFEIPDHSAKQAEPQAQPIRSSAPRFRRNIPSRGNLPFVGRNDLLTQISSLLSDRTSENVVILHGQPGVGKSELAREFARRNRDRYSGGTFLVDASTDALAINLAAIGKTILDLPLRADLPLNDQGQQTFYALGDVPVLLIYDNVRSFERAVPWLPLSGMQCHILITTLDASANRMWPCLEVPPLSREQSLELVERLTGGQLAPPLAEAIAEHAGGLPVQIIPDAATLADEYRRGGAGFGGFRLARGAGDSFRSAYDRLDPSARLLIHAAALLNPQHIPAKELSYHLLEGLGWSAIDVQRTLDSCLDVHLLSGSPDPAMHQLFASFLRETVPSEDDQSKLARVRPVQLRRLVQLADAVSRNPADIQTAATLLSYPLSPETWTNLGLPLSVDEENTIGSALSEIGHYDEARLWFERTVAAEQRGEPLGHVDYGKLGTSQHQLGDCLASKGRYQEALPWFERAVEAKEKGDLQGRVDYASLGGSLSQVGDCLASRNLYEEAQSWFERAVKAKEKGDVDQNVDRASLALSLHGTGYCLSARGLYDEALPIFKRAVEAIERGDVAGRVDYARLGRSLHQVGYCLSLKRSYDEAQQWFERAVSAAEKGDIYGRVDYASVSRAVHQVGFCLSRKEQYPEALRWFRRAAADAEKGDVYGRVDHESRGRSLHQMADCVLKVGKVEEAREWFERAVAEKEKGDVHGNIERESVEISREGVVACNRARSEGATAS
jgi:tetratricopeptide (TPR) repeat protein/UDP-2,3-diacylglucosamine pyrophosphatase LpxH